LGKDKKTSPESENSAFLNPKNASKITTFISRKSLLYNRFFRRENKVRKGKALIKNGYEKRSKRARES
jgi:hypothetical protein